MHNCNFQGAFYFYPCHSWQELPAPTLGWFPSPGVTDPEPTTILPKGPKKSANKEVNGKFDYNKTPLAPLGTKGLVYNDPAIRASWASHSTNVHYIGLALKHYWCLRCYMPSTRQYRVADTWQLYLTHCTTPALSQAECMILKATDTLTALGSTVLTFTSASVACTQAIQKLCNIFLPILNLGTSNPIATDMPSLRVLCPQSPPMPEPRVPTLGLSPRVVYANARTIAPPTTCTTTQTLTTLHDPTAPSNIWILQPVHQWHTRTNNPFAILEDDTPDDDNDNITDNLTVTVQAENCTNGTKLGTSLQQLCLPASCMNTPMVLTNPHASPAHDLWPTATPTLIPQPWLLQSTCHQPIANPTTIEPQHLLQSTMPTVEPAMPKDQQSYPHYIPPNNDKRDANIQQPDWAICLLSPQGPTSIAIHALYHVTNLPFNNLPSYTIPTKLNNSSNRFQHNITIEEVCNGIVHPITKESITKITKLMDDPALKDLWVPTMSKELHDLAQGKEGVTVGTNTIFYLTHAEIMHIPKDCTITYARIVINHRPQKDNPNQVQITVGGNLIE
jgi:hypothetical protein